MSVFATKVLAKLVYPLNVSLALATIAGVLFWLNRHRLGGLCLVLSIGWLWLWSTPVFSIAVRASLEQRYPPLPLEELPMADAILVLGGGVKRAAPPARLGPDLGPAADRIWHAARLFHAGKAPRILLSGGLLPWTGVREPEAPAMLELLKSFGIPESVVLLETQSMNTWENALFSAPILKEHDMDRVFLVTSALHMPRALATFRAMGIKALPAPTDFEAVPMPNTALAWLPSAQALESSTRAFKEYLGLLVYRIRFALFTHGGG